MLQIKKEIIALLSKAGVDGDIILTSPPNPALGDFAFACFALAKERKKNPVDVAKQIEAEVRHRPPAGSRPRRESPKSKVIERVQAAGPYVNFWLDPVVVAEVVLRGLQEAGNHYGAHTLGRGKKVLVEYACPNPLKAFHLGHLRNLVTGESVARILENANYHVVRVNYQGDVGMHVAKALWAIRLQTSDFRLQTSRPLPERVAFLGQAYAQGATKFEDDEKAKAEIVDLNEKIYQHDPSIAELYQTTRQWSLDYFDTIYAKLGTRFDRLYFESEVVGGKDIVLKYLAKGVFAKGEGGAIIFPGSKYGLHDRVFVNGQGYPTYEAKELALAELHFKENKPDRVIHVVGKEQAEYFKVVFTALAQVLPQTKDKEFHLVGGYLQLKGEKKMSSRTGNVVTGDELMAQVEERVREIMEETKAARSDRRYAINDIVGKVTVAALKYALLKVGVAEDMAFDMEQSVSTTGDSGPYLLYIVARIKSILRKEQGTRSKEQTKAPDTIGAQEKQLLLRLAEFPEITRVAADRLDPSAIAQYLFRLAQAFNIFYEFCPVLQAEEEMVKQFRFWLIHAVADVMSSGLKLLGIETVEEM